MSSDDIVISVKNISKCFEIYQQPIHRLLQTLCAGTKKFYREFWALRNISFDVRRGECVGIIGKNGAGKSTLLQILTGILRPTSGSVEVHGKVAALLELGSGFNPEFTGRENVYMNAAILGLSASETSAKYQEIVDFADIGDFIDQPVKTYSSGMMVRLAFAVQILVEPDILIVDEALAVGDAAFQRKCYARMDALLEKGMTLLLVTHDTETVKQRCKRVIFLKDSEVFFDGPAQEGVTEYMRYLFPNEFLLKPAESSRTPAQKINNLENGFVYEKNDLHTLKTQWGVGGGFIPSIRIYGLEPPNILRTPAKIRIEVQAVWDKDFVAQKIRQEHLYPSMMIGIRLSDVKNIPVYGTNNAIEKVEINPLERESATVVYELDLPMLKNGDLFLTAAVGVGVMSGHVHLVWDDLAVHLQSVSDSESDGMVYCDTKLSVK